MGIRVRGLSTGKVSGATVQTIHESLTMRFHLGVMLACVRNSNTSGRRSLIFVAKLSTNYNVNTYSVLSVWEGRPYREELLAGALYQIWIPECPENEGNEDTSLAVDTYVISDPVCSDAYVESY